MRITNRALEGLRRPSSRAAGRHARGLATPFLAGLAVAAGLAWHQTAVADQVTLQTRDGAFTISGELLDSAGGFLTVRTSMGQVRVPIGQVTCTGSACPLETRAATDAAPADLTIGIAADLPPDLPGLLVRAYAAVAGVDVSAAEDGRSWTVTGAAGSFRLVPGDPATAALRVQMADAQAARGARVVLALDPVVAVAAPGSRPSALSLQDLSDIFSGRLRNWSELHTRGGGIVAVLPAGDPTVDGVVRDDILASRPLSAGVVRADDASGIVLSTPGAIALMRGSARRGLPPTTLAGPCGLTAGAGIFAVRSGQYPLVGRVVLNADDEAMTAPVRAFVDFMATEAGQNAIGTSGLVGQSIIPASGDWVADWIASAAKLVQFAGGDDAGAVLQDLVEATTRATRLSVTLRYVFDLREPDAQARGDFARLAAAIARGQFDGNRIVFMGHADAGASVARDRAAASTAADRVLRDFMAAHPGALARRGIALSAAGFGGIAPLACPGSGAGRIVDRRVEVWVRPL